LKLLIFGFGHLANFIARENDKFQIDATYRSKQPNNKKINKYLSFTLGDALFDISGYDFILINIPPQEHLIDLLHQVFENKKENQRIIFISSTSVYGTGIIDESKPLLGKPRSGEFLLDCERYLLDKKVIILRPSGLVDATRDPRNFVKKFKVIQRANHTINFIHTEDLARFILICHELEDLVYNVSAPIHHKRIDFYKAILDKPQNFIFKFSSEAEDKVISSHQNKVREFKYKYPDLLEYFKN